MIKTNPSSLKSRLPLSKKRVISEYWVSNSLVGAYAIAHFLDPDSVTFDDCQVKVEQASIAWLKQYAGNAAVTAA